MEQGKYSRPSDVFATGVMMWEVFEMGEQPWRGLKNSQVMMKVKTGEVLRKGRNTKHQVYSVMKECWKVKPVGKNKNESTDGANGCCRIWS